MRSRSGNRSSGARWRAWLCAGIATVVGGAEVFAQTVLDTNAVLYTTTRTALIEPKATDKWLFGRIRDVAVDTRNQVYVLDDGEHVIRVFSATGTLLRTMGRKGMGPGEFEKPRGLQLLGDTLFLEDGIGDRQVSYSIITGKATNNRRPAGMVTGFALSPSGMYTGVAPEIENDRTRAVPFTLGHTDVVNKESRVLATYQIRNKRLTYSSFRKGVARVGNSKGGTMHTNQPFGDFPITSVPQNGSAMFILERSMTDVPSNRNPFATNRQQSPFRIRQIAPNGREISSRQFLTPSRNISSTDIKSVIDSMLEADFHLPGAVFVARSSDIRDSLHVPQTWPPVTWMYVGIDGSVWLRQPRPPSTPPRYWRIDANGNALPAVTVASQLFIMRVSADQLWAMSSDEDGNPTVEVHRVVKK